MVEVVVTVISGVIGALAALTTFLLNLRTLLKQRARQDEAARLLQGTWRRRRRRSSPGRIRYGSDAGASS